MTLSPRIAALKRILYFQQLRGYSFAALSFLAVLCVVCMPEVALAATAVPLVPGSSPDSGDTAWILTASALVLFMTLPGLALFYGGLVRSRNFLSVLMHCFTITALVSILWVVCGYSLIFSADGSPWIGTLANALLVDIADLRAGLTFSESGFALFQMTFAIITPALIIGALVERVRFGWLVGFTLLWMLIVYIPVARWVWGGGWMAERGVLDFAGGIVVHTTAGVSALVLAMILGRRKGFPQQLMLPHAPSLTLVGAGMLWVGWFGFNGGSALAADGAAASAIIATHLAASAAALTWIGIEWLKLGKPTSIGFATGAIAGLATVTPAAGFISPAFAIAMGVSAGIVCFLAVQLVRFRLHIDDSLDVFAVHGVGGVLGSLLLAFGLAPMLGGPGYSETMSMATQFGEQALAVGFTMVWSIVGTLAAAYAVRAVIPMRVSSDDERDGLDISSHGERAWEMD